MESVILCTKEIERIGVIGVKEVCFLQIRQLVCGK